MTAKIDNQRTGTVILYKYSALYVLYIFSTLGYSLSLSLSLFVYFLLLPHYKLSGLPPGVLPTCDKISLCKVQVAETLFLIPGNETSHFYKLQGPTPSQVPSK